jgi:phenylacetate-CoA ligase
LYLRRNISAEFERGGGVNSPVENLAELLDAISQQYELQHRRAGTPSEVLSRFLTHAISTTPFYQALALNEQSAIGNFPLIDRGLVSSKAKSFLSLKFDRSQISITTTSGTSGTPLTVYRDEISSFAAFYDVFRSIGYGILESRYHPSAGSCFAIVVNDNPDRSPLTTVNPAINFSFVRRIVLGKGEESDREQTIVSHTEQPPLVCGRPRSLLNYAEVLKRLELSIRPQAVFSSGDNLYENERQTISAAFGCKVYNGYASQECGLIALECECGEGLHFVGGRVFVEVINSNDPTTISDTGEGELVVTNCDNWAMPLIRYRTGDVGVVERGPCACGKSGPILRKLDGRRSVYFEVDNRKINPSILNPFFEALPIRQFQVEQSAVNEFNVRWIADGLVNEELVSKHISTFFHQCIGVFPATIQVAMSIGRSGEKVQRYVRL